MLSWRSRGSSSTSLRYTAVPTSDPTALERVEAALSQAAGASVELERPANPEHGDYATNVALRLAGTLRRPPLEIAGELSEAVRGIPGVERTEAAPPGFVNLRMSDPWLGGALAEIGPDYGGGSAESREGVQGEMGSAKPTGPITV